MTLPELLAAYARGETDAQHQVLEEFEPLVFGYARSLGGGDHDAAVATTHALTLAFHLRAAAGQVQPRDAAALRALAHGLVSRKLQDSDPVRLRSLADPVTASMVYVCFGIGLTLDAELDPREIEEFAARLEGKPATAFWKVTEAKIKPLGLLR